MKHTIFLSAILAGALFAGVVIAQSVVSGPSPPKPIQKYNPKTLPPLQLHEAYPLALSELSTAVFAPNQYYCVSANCLNTLPSTSAGNSHGNQGWVFGFASTNGHNVLVFVFFDKATAHDRHCGLLQLP